MFDVAVKTPLGMLASKCLDSGYISAPSSSYLLSVYAGRQKEMIQLVGSLPSYRRL